MKDFGYIIFERVALACKSRQKLGLFALVDQKIDIAGSAVDPMNGECESSNQSMVDSCSFQDLM